MKVSLLQEHLLQPLLFVGKNISIKTQMPITQHVLLSAKDGFLRLTTTNIETTVSTLIAVKTDKNGGLCVPSKLLTEFVSSLPPGKIDFEAKEQSLIVTAKGYKAVLPGIGKEEFPPVPERKKTDARINAKEFMNAVRSVIYAAATDEGRPLLTGVKIQKTENGTLFVATDGYRLSLMKTKVALKSGFDRVIPSRALVHVLQLSEDGDIEFTDIGDGQVGFFSGDSEVYTRVLDGEYPAFDRIIPKSNSTTAAVKKEALVHAVKTAAIFAKDSANIVRFHFENSTATVSANTPQVGESKIDIFAETEGDDGDIAFNSRFILDFLNNASAEKILIEITGSLNPGVFKTVGNDAFLHIIMPVRVQTDA